jgi:hypothetical protein
VVLLDQPSSLAASADEKKGDLPLQNSRLGFFSEPSGRSTWTCVVTLKFASGCEGYGYESASGRAEWLSRDPIAEQGGLNLYGYVRNNSIKYTDPLGFCEFGLTEEDLNNLDQLYDFYKRFDEYNSNINLALDFFEMTDPLVFVLDVTFDQFVGMTGAQDAVYNGIRNSLPVRPPPPMAPTFGDPVNSGSPQIQFGDPSSGLGSPQIQF